MDPAGRRMNIGCICTPNTEPGGSSNAATTPNPHDQKISSCPRSHPLHPLRWDPPMSPWVPCRCHSHLGQTSYCVMRPLGSTGSSHFRNIMSSSGVKVRDSEAMPPGTGEGKGTCSDATRNQAGRRNPLGNQPPDRAVPALDDDAPATLPDPPVTLCHGVGRSPRHSTNPAGTFSGIVSSFQCTEQAPVPSPAELT